MKVFVATHAYTGNGAAVMLLAVLKHWVKTLGWTVDVFFPIDKEVPEELAATGVNAFGSLNPKEYDFALVNTLVSCSLLEQLAPHVPTVLWVHEGATVVWNSSIPPLKWRQLFELPCKIVFQTPWQPDVVFRSFIPPELTSKVACVMNGLPPLPSDVVRKPCSDGKKRVVFLGGVYARKRPFDLVDAILAMRRDDVECIFAGSTSVIHSIGSEHLERLNARRDIFRLLGEVDRRTSLEYLSGADVFCLPSEDESQPIAPLEAAVLGIPCVLSDLAPYKGMWHHGVNCLMQPVANVALLAQNLTTCLDNEPIREQLIGAARSYAQRLSMDAFLSRFTAEMPV